MDSAVVRPGRVVGVAGLSAVSCALTVASCWFITCYVRVARRPGVERRSGSNRWLLGLTIGLVFGVASLVVGTIAWAAGIVALVLLAIDRDRILLVGGACLGFGVAWLAIMLLADSRCQEGCSGPDITPWVAAGAAWVLVGVGLSLFGFRSAARRRDSPPA